MQHMERGRSPHKEQERTPCPDVRPDFVAELAHRLGLSSPETSELQAFAACLVREASGHVRAQEAEAHRFRALAAAFKRDRFEMSAPGRGGNRHG